MQRSAVSPSRSKTRHRVSTYINWLVATAVVLVFALAEWWTEKSVSYYSRAETTAIEIAIVLIGTLAFRPIHERVDRFIENALTRRERRARAQIYKLARELPSFSDAAQLMRRVVEGVDHYMHGDGCAIYLRESDYVPAASTFDSRIEPVGVSDPLVIRLRSSSLPADPRLLDSSAPGSIACPMMAGGELVGFLVIASKKDYAPEERQILSGLAEAAGIALAFLTPSLAMPKEKAERGNLPMEVASFVGRQDDVSALGQLISSHRLVCVKGPGGIGKSRLALRAAHEYRAHAPRNAAWFVDFSGTARADNLAGTIARSIGISQSPGKTESENVVAFFETRSALVILDNCEHLIDPMAELCSSLLAACANLRFLATSREPLAIAGEAVYTVPPLDPLQSVILFRERALEVGVRLEDSGVEERDVLEVLTHLDGLPFAIELAAARLRLMSVKELASHIGQRLQRLTTQNRMAAPRQQTLRALIDWSYRLLLRDERLLFSRLAVFPYTFDLSTAADVCDAAPLSGSEVVALLGSLIDKSLVQTEAGPDGQRFRMLESTRMFAIELCSTADLQTLRGRHARHFRDLARRLMDPNLSDYDRRMRQVRTDIENVYAAMEWGLRDGDLNASVHIAESLRLFWFHYAQLRTGRQWFTRILERSSDLDPTQLAAMHIGLAIVSEFSNPTASMASAELAVGVYRKADDLAALAQSLTVLGIAQRSLGLYDKARRSYEESLTIYEQLGSERANTVAGTLAALLTDCYPSEFALARQLYDRCLQSARRTGARGTEGVMLGNMAQLALLGDDFETAYRLSAESIGIARELGATPVLAAFLPIFASAAHRLGHSVQGCEALTEALRLFAEAGDEDPEHTGAALDAAVEFLEVERRHGEAALLYGMAQEYRAKRNTPRVPTMQTHFDETMKALLPFADTTPASIEPESNEIPVEFFSRVLQSVSPSLGRTAPSADSLNRVRST